MNNFTTEILKFNPCCTDELMVLMAVMQVLSITWKPGMSRSMRGGWFNPQDEERISSKLERLKGKGGVGVVLYVRRADGETMGEFQAA